MPKEQEEAASDLYRYSGLGLQFAAVVGLFALTGRWLDGRFDTSPWLLLVGVFLGFGLGLYSMIRKLPALTRESAPHSHDHANDDDDLRPPR